MTPNPNTKILRALPSVPERIGSEICRRKGHFLASERRNPSAPL
jgi:hypothetical protein